MTTLANFTSEFESFACFSFFSLSWDSGGKLRIPDASSKDTLSWCQVLVFMSLGLSKFYHFYINV